MVSDVLSAISDDKSLLLFNTVALSSGSTDILITKLGLTKKQYYSRMSALTNAALISRSNGKYFLTSFGKVVYEAQLLIGKAKQNYWKLRAIDSVARGMSSEEGSKIIETLIVEDDLKEILLGRKQTNLVEKQSLVVI
jgi:predicted transcriptional regulator